MRLTGWKGEAVMQKRLLVVILALGLGCAWAGVGLAGDVGYRFRGERPGLEEIPGPPSSAKVFADAVIARPAGLALTIADTGIFLITLPFSAASGSIEETGWGLVGRPAAWTFKRPLGRDIPEYEERSLFRAR